MEITESSNPQFETLKVSVFANNNMASAFKCEKCSEERVPIIPYSCDNGHTFCKKCIDHCLENKETCPNGNHEITTTKENVGIQNIIHNLQIMCPMTPINDEFDNNNINDSEIDTLDSVNKCEWKGDVGSLLDHLSECTLYIELNKSFESDIRLNEFKTIIGKLTQENASMKQCMEKMSKQINDMQEVLDIVQQEIVNLKRNSVNNNITYKTITSHPMICPFANACSLKHTFNKNTSSFLYHLHLHAKMRQTITRSFLDKYVGVNSGMCPKCTKFFVCLKNHRKCKAQPIAISIAISVSNDTNNESKDNNIAYQSSTDNVHICDAENNNDLEEKSDILNNANTDCGLDNMTLDDTKDVDSQETGHDMVLC